jgi:hypothetical protein
MKNNVKVAFVSALAVALDLTACTSTPDQNAATQTQTQTSTPSPSVVTEVETATVTNPPKSLADGRPGYGALKLGMTLEEARATGQTNLSFSEGNPFCVSDDKVAISKQDGVSRITLPADGRTSKGIAIGYGIDQVRMAYPNAQEYRAGLSVNLDGYSYAFLIEKDTVVAIKLLSNGGASGCDQADL